MFNQQLLHGHSKVTGSFRQLNRKKGKKLKKKNCKATLNFTLYKKKAYKVILLTAIVTPSLSKRNRCNNSCVRNYLPPPPSLKITQPPALKPHAPLPPQPCLFLSQFLNFILFSSFFLQLLYKNNTPLFRVLTSLAEVARSAWTCSVRDGPDFNPTALVFRKQIKAVKWIVYTE